MSRTLGRDCGFKLVFQFLFSKNFAINDYLNDCEFSEEEKDFALTIYKSVETNLDSLNTKLVSNLKNDLKLTDLYSLDYAILLITMAQIDYLNIPKDISINEAVRLAKKYSTDKSSSFVNGVLSSIYN